MSMLLVLAAALLGSLTGYVTVKHLGGSRAKSMAVIAALIVVAAIAAVGANASQTLLDLGLPFTAVDVIEAASYFVFGFSLTAAWVLLKPSRLRWLLLALVPIAFIDPLHFGFRLAMWAFKRLTAA
jgi:hypothetical protein